MCVLDGETAPAGGMGVCRQIKDEIFDCPPVLLLIGRPQDAWLASWSRAEAAVSHPIDPVALAGALAGLLRSDGGRPASLSIPAGCSFLSSPASSRTLRTYGRPDVLRPGDGAASAA